MDKRKDRGSKIAAISNGEASAGYAELCRDTKNNHRGLLRYCSMDALAFAALGFDEATEYSWVWGLAFRVWRFVSEAETDAVDIVK